MGRKIQHISCIGGGERKEIANFNLEAMSRPCLFVAPQGPKANKAKNFNLSKTYHVLEQLKQYLLPSKEVEMGLHQVFYNLNCIVSLGKMTKIGKIPSPLGLPFIFSSPHHQYFSQQKYHN